MRSTLELNVTKSGEVDSVRVLDAEGVDEACQSCLIAALRRWRFSPGHPGVVRYPLSVELEPPRVDAVYTTTRKAAVFPTRTFDSVPMSNR